MAKADIIIAEDDAALLNLCMKKFVAAGYSVRTAEDGERAIALIQEQAPDLLILDIHIPKADGFQVLQQCPRSSRNFPIIIVTNFSEPEFKLRGMELGADDYFVKKDMTIRSLVQMVERHLVNKIH